MESFSKNQKSENAYLEQLKNNTEEKVGALIQSLEDRNLPEVDGVTRVMEMGVGSGDGIERIKSEIKNPDLEVYAVDILEALVKRVHSPEDKVFGVAADLTQLPFRENTFSGINLSSVVHEALSYNPELLEGNVSIDEYIKKLFQQLIFLTQEGGRIFYRDVGLSDNSNVLLSGGYDNSVADFISAFDDVFRNRFLALTQSDIEIDLSSKDGVTVHGSAHYHREIQRHLISYLDYALRQNSGISFKDALTDVSENRLDFDVLKASVETVCADTFIFDGWQKREGSEMYTYRSVNEIVELIEEVGVEDRTFEVEFAEVVDRPLYSRYLKSVTNAALPDTKQNLILKKK